MFYLMVLVSLSSLTVRDYVFVTVSRTKQLKTMAEDLVQNASQAEIELKIT